MSTLAESYYQGRAEQFQINAIPPILNGQPAPLNPGGVPLSIHGLSTHSETPVSTTFHELLVSTHDYLAQSLPPEYRKLVTYDDKVTVGKNGDFARRALSSLLVSHKISTGKVRDAQIEAVARQEIPHRPLQTLHGLKTETKLIGDGGEAHEAYFRLWGDIRSGTKTSTGQGLAVVSFMLLQRMRHDEPRGPKMVVPVHHGIKIARWTV